MKDLTTYERDLWARGFALVAGVDEAGRGALAGPLVAAAVILPEGFGPDGVDDSKRMSEAQRATAYPRILANALAVSVGWVSPATIDSAAERGEFDRCHRDLLQRTIEALHPKPDHVLVDFMEIPGLSVPCQSLPHLDAESVSVAAASVVAKVTRDRMMADFDRLFPEWGFAAHKGYGGGDGRHEAAIAKYGISPIHRRSFTKR